MKYIALLRGVNISGKNKISMPELKKKFENLNYKNVITCLNSGNVIFEADIQSKEKIIKDVYNMIKEEFNLEIPIFLIEKSELKELLNNQPKWWGTENKEIYDNIIFIIEPYTYKQVASLLGEPKEGLEETYEYKNNIFWSYNLENYRKSLWWSKTASPEVKDKITIRTANTIKKILNLCEK